MAFVGKQKQEEINKKKNKSFDVTNEDDKAFFDKGRSSGLTDTQLAIALTKKKQLINEGVDASKVYKPGENMSVTVGIDGDDDVSNNPFKGYSRQEVLRIAFLQGITKKSQLQEIADTYDLVMGTGEKDDEVIKQEDFAKAQQFISDNPDATKEEVTVALRRYTNLDATDINALIGSSGVVSQEDVTDFSDDELRSYAVDLVKEYTGLFTNAKEGKQNAVSEITSDTSLTKTQKDKLLAIIEEEYPQGRSLLSKLLPGGK